MTNLLDSAEIEIPCENCARKTKKSIGWIKSHDNLACTCGAIITINASKFKGQIATIERNYAALQKTLKNFGK